MACRVRTLKLTEKAFQAQVLQFAKLHGWSPVHFRQARTLTGWRTAVEGDGIGWPDLILVRPPRFVVAELKRDGGTPTEAQAGWLEKLRACPGIETYLWRPARWPEIERVLGGDP